MLPQVTHRAAREVEPGELVAVKGGVPVTNSRVVAEKFGKQHAHVIRAIRGLECSAEFNRSNFGLVEYLDAKGERRPYYTMTRDGFTFLAMGFTGKVAANYQPNPMSVGGICG